MASALRIELDADTSISSFADSDYEKIIIDSQFLKRNLIAYDARTVIALEDGESLQEYLAVWDKFIFNRTDKRELGLALHVVTKPAKISAERKVRSGELTYDYITNRYYIGEVEVYLAKQEARYLKMRLEGQRTDQADRQILYRLRKKFGRDFLIKGSSE